MENYKVDIYNIFKIIQKYPQLCIRLATQIHEHIASGKQVPQSAKSFLYKNRSKVLYGQLEKHVKERHLTGLVSLGNLALFGALITSRTDEWRNSTQIVLLLIYVFLVVVL